MDQKIVLRLRLQNCIGTIRDVHNAIWDEQENPDFLTQVDALNQSLQDLDMNDISEIDVVMVEAATNALLGEFQPFFEPSTVLDRHVLT
jgi:hypothetical protein